MRRGRKRNDITEDQRQKIFDRDQYCLFCGARSLLTLQHRRSKGMGGLGGKEPPLTCASGLVLCQRHNDMADNDPGFRTIAIRFGWKILRKWDWPDQWIPYFDVTRATWWMPDPLGDRVRVEPETAMKIIEDLIERQGT